MALQIKLQLGTAAYATMAIREITKTDTSTQSQTNLTQTADDRLFKGTGTTSVLDPPDQPPEADEEAEVEEEVTRAVTMDVDDEPLNT